MKIQGKFHFEVVSSLTFLSCKFGDTPVPSDFVRTEGCATNVNLVSPVGFGSGVLDNILSSLCSGSSAELHLK